MRMVMNKSLQVYTISKMLERKGIDPRTVDIEALVDSSLSFSENLRIVEEAVGIALRNERPSFDGAIIEIDANGNVIVKELEKELKDGTKVRIEVDRLGNIVDTLSFILKYSRVKEFEVDGAIRFRLRDNTLELELEDNGTRLRLKSELLPGFVHLSHDIVRRVVEYLFS